MKITRRTIEFTVEKSEKFLVHRRTAIFARCDFCERQVKMLSPESAAETIAVTPRTIYRLVEENQVHFTETDGRQLLICFESLSKRSIK